MANILSDDAVIERIFHHIDNKSTDLGDNDWQEPTTNYSCPDRFKQEQELFNFIDFYMHMYRSGIIICPPG